MKEITRRTFFQSTAALAPALPLLAQSGKLKVAIFSKHLEFLDGEALAKGVGRQGLHGQKPAAKAV